MTQYFSHWGSIVWGSLNDARVLQALLFRHLFLGYPICLTGLVINFSSIKYSPGRTSVHGSMEIWWAGCRKLSVKSTAVDNFPQPTNLLTVDTLFIFLGCLVLKEMKHLMVVGHGKCYYKYAGTMNTWWLTNRDQSNAIFLNRCFLYLD